uniref:Uncharacterized protein n=1 Tax=Oryza barthii TaxID=65489 RepID=A0A0D3GIU8_9ORYZ
MELIKAAPCCYGELNSANCAYARGANEEAVQSTPTPSPLLKEFISSIAVVADKGGDAKMSISFTREC